MFDLSSRRALLVLSILLLPISSISLVAQSPGSPSGSDPSESSFDAPSTGDRSWQRPEDSEELMLAAVRLIEYGSVREATLRLEQLVVKYPYWPEPRIQLAVQYAAVGRYGEAASALEAALRADPTSRSAFESRLAVYKRLDAEGAGSKGARERPMVEPMASPSEEALTPIVKTVSQQLVETVAAWAIAWSDQQVEEYLSFYSEAFEPPGSMDLQAWRTQRRERIQRPSSISVTVSFVTPRFAESGRAEVYFVQAYRSDSYRDIVRKTLVMVEENGQWKIVEERVEG